MTRKELVLEFLLKVDKEFKPALSEKTSIEEYVDKISSLAELIVAEDDNGIYGLTVLYCNDMLEKRAYVALVGVLPEYRGKGVARQMMIETIRRAVEKGMCRIGIHTNNPVALNLYKKLGFEVISGGDRKYLEYVIKV